MRNILETKENWVADSEAKIRDMEKKKKNLRKIKNTTQSVMESRCYVNERSKGKKNYDMEIAAQKLRRITFCSINLCCPVSFHNVWRWVCLLSEGWSHSGRSWENRRFQNGESMSKLNYYIHELIVNKLCISILLDSSFVKWSTFSSIFNWLKALIAVLKIIL